VRRLFVDVHLEILGQPLHVRGRRRDSRREPEIIPAEEGDDRRLDARHHRLGRRRAIEDDGGVEPLDFRG
jgi:hypothetical protein